MPTSHPHQPTDRLTAPLLDVASRAVDCALRRLDNLDGLEDADFDRGARAAESLMRVATSACALRADIDRSRSGNERRHKSGTDAGTGPATHDDEIRRLIDHFNQRIDDAERDAARPQSALHDGDHQ